jgi:hypothetical protein
MTRRSITGPVLLLLIGALFLWRNLHPEIPIFEVVARYWPFLLIVWGLMRLVEVLLHPRDAWRYGFTGGEIVLVILICLAGSGMFAANRHGIRFSSGGLDWWGQQYDYTVSAEAPATGVRSIVFENPRGNVRVVGGDEGKVAIAGHQVIRALSRSDADRAHAAAPLEIVPQGDRLLVRTNQDRAQDNQRISVDLEVTVPRAIAIESRGRTGDYDISGISGEVALAADRGDVRLSRIDGNVRLEINHSDLIRATDVKGTLDVRGRGSDLDLANISGQVTISGAYSGTLDFKNLTGPLQFEGRNTELRVQGLPGTITMSLGGFNGRNLEGPVRLVTRSRDVRFEQFTKSLELQADRGDVQLVPGRAPLPAIEARSVGGSIEVVLPDKAAFQLHAVADRGEAVNDYGPQVQQETEGQTSTLSAKTGDGPTIHITSTRGTVSVRKEGAPRSLPAPPPPPEPHGRHGNARPRPMEGTDI